jgi:hypothetical protein
MGNDKNERDNKAYRDGYEAVDTKEAYSWKLPEKDAQSLAHLLDVDVDEIVVRDSLVDSEAPRCSHCGRQSGLLDIAKTAIDYSHHGARFLRTFFLKGDMSNVATADEMNKVLEIEHNVACFDCGEWHNTKSKWIIPMW